MNKADLKIGDKIYLRQFTGSYYIDAIKRPYTVIDVNAKEVKVQSCKYIWPIYKCCGNPYLDRPDLEGERVQFYDTIPETILPDENGNIEILTWHSKKALWGTPGRDRDYPEYAIKTEEYQYYPYLD